MDIIHTRLFIPQLRSRLVNRPRLYRKLDQGKDCGFVLVSAPAGYGKSTLLGDWLRQDTRSATWLSLDETDNDPARFLPYLAAALTSVAPQAGKNLSLSLQTASRPPTDLLLTRLVNDLSAVSGQFWLVLDDYHAIHNPEIHQAIAFLIDHRPPPMCLVISTRADPPLPLSRLRARSQIIEVRLGDLRFSTSEISEFLREVMGLNLSEEDLAGLEAHTEGWAAGLQMAGLSLQGREDASAFIRAFSGENRFILDYLFEEVFKQQPAEVRTFLTQVSILERLSGPLCDHITGRTDSQVMLEHLQHGNLFLVPLDDQNRWFRFHNLFSDLLKHRLLQAPQEERALLHRRACAWFGAEGLLEFAITQAFAAGDHEQAARLIEQAVQGLDRQNQQALLASWTNQLPHDILENHPWLCVHRAWGEYWTGRRGREEDWLQAAERAINRADAPGSPERRRIEGHIAAVRAHTAIVTEDVPRILAMAQAALDLLPQDDPMRCETAIALGAAYWAQGDAAQSERAFNLARTPVLIRKYPSMVVGPTCYAGMQQVKQGCLGEALATFRHGLQAATRPDGGENPIAGFPNAKIGDVLRERNRLDLALDFLTRGADQAFLFGQPDVLTDVYVCLARCQLASGLPEAAQATLDRAAAVARQSQVDPFVLTWLDECRVKTWLAGGNLEAVDRWTATCGLDPEGPLSYLHDLPQQVLARAWVALAAHEKAAPLLRRLLVATEQAGWVHETIKGLVLQTLNEWTRGETRAAVSTLARAVSLAEPGGYVRVFLDEGPGMQSALAALMNSLKKSSLPGNDHPPEVLNRLKAYAGALLTAFDGPSNAQPQQGHHPALAEPLSEREMDVLALLAEGCSDRKIAERLVIARETVHKHLKNIYGKLDVHSRTEAIARSRVLGLLKTP